MKLPSSRNMCLRSIFPASIMNSGKRKMINSAGSWKDMKDTGGGGGGGDDLVDVSTEGM